VDVLDQPDAEFQRVGQAGPLIAVPVSIDA
jgi:hypothetical protein